MDQNLLMMLPGIQPDELITIQNLTKDMTEAEQRQFISLYQGKRKDSQTILILALLGFFGIAGIHRLVVGDIVMGIVYFFTLGFCGIGTIIDIINCKGIVSDYNQKQALESANMLRMMTR